MIIGPLRAIYTKNLGIKKGERVLVFTDRFSEESPADPVDFCRRERLRDIAILTAEIGKSYTKNVIYCEFPATQSHGAEPPEEIWRRAFGERAVREIEEAKLLRPLLLKEIRSDGLARVEQIIRRQRRSAVHAVIAFSHHSTSHTRFRSLLTTICGTRYASMPLFEVSMLEGAMNVDWRQLAQRTNAVARLLNRAEFIEIKSPNGTHLRFSKAGRRAAADTGILRRPGSFGNLPAGEAYIAPLEGTAEGRLVLEWAPTRRLDSPVTLTVKRGYVVKIEGREKFVRELWHRLEERRDNANIAELGIGTNSNARRPDNILESEKILGTIHIALGDNSSFGGMVQTPFHQDFIFFSPTVTLITKDGAKVQLLKKGRLIEN